VNFYLVGTDGGALQTARKLNHLYIAVSERYETLINFSAKGLPPLINGKPWKYVYAVNDFGVGASTNAPYFCKTHLLARFDILDLPITAGYDRDIDTLWPPPTTTLGPKGVSGVSLYTLLLSYRTILYTLLLYCTALYCSVLCCTVLYTHYCCRTAAALA
jgi:hypothetical protein